MNKLESTFWSTSTLSKRSWQIRSIEASRNSKNSCKLLKKWWPNKVPSFTTTNWSTWKPWENCRLRVLSSSSKTSPKFKKKIEKCSNSKKSSFRLSWSLLLNKKIPSEKIICNLPQVVTRPFLKWTTKLRPWQLSWTWLHRQKKKKRKRWKDNFLPSTMSSRVTERWWKSRSESRWRRCRKITKNIIWTRKSGKSKWHCLI